MSYQTIMEDFFSDFDISIDIFRNEDDKRTKKVTTKIFNKSLIIANIRPNVNAVITLSSNGICDYNEGFNVKIVHKDNGKIAGQWFAFKDFLPITCKVGASKTNVAYLIMRDEWYGTKPNEDDVRNMVQKIMNYIGLWV